MTDSTQHRPVSLHRPARLKLPDDPQEAAAMALAYIRGDDSFNRARAIEGLIARVAIQSNAGSDESLKELAAQAVILDTLFLRLSTDAMATSSPAHQSTLMRMALAAQTASARTIALIAGLKLQQQGRGQVTIQDEGEVIS